MRLKAVEKSGLKFNDDWNASEKDEMTAVLSRITDGYSIKTEAPWQELKVFPGRKRDASVFYFELRVVNSGNESQMGIGIGDKSTEEDTIPGWNRGGNTCGYHGDNGLKYWKMGQGKPYAEKYATGDVIGCGYDVASSTVFFTKNGKFLGVAFRDIPHLEYYPMCGSLEPCEVSFVLSPPFAFDIDTFYVTNQFDFSNSKSKKMKK
jgi:hypothetical protein